MKVQTKDECRIEYQGKYILEDDNTRYILVDNLLSNKSFNIVASLGSGKTTFLINYFTVSKDPVIFLVPLVSLRKELISNYSNMCIVGNDTDINTIKQSNFIISTYEGFGRIIKVIDSLDKYTLVIDEAHNLIIQLNFRREAIYKIIEAKSKFKQVIKISGTPEGIFVKHEYNLVLKRKTADPIEKRKITIVDFKGDLEKYIYELITSHISKGVIVIYLNDKKKGANLFEFLTQNNVNKDQILLLSSELNKKNIYDEFESENEFQELENSKLLFHHVQETNEIPDDVKILISTSVISDGINIYGIKNPISLIITVDSVNLISQRQFISRFRNYSGKIIDIISGNKKHFFNSKDTYLDNYKFPNDLNEYLSEIITLTEELNSDNKYKTLFEDQNIIKMFETLEKNKAANILINRSSESSKVTYIAEPIQYFLLSAIDKECYSNLELRKEYYQSIAGFNAEIENKAYEKDINKIIAELFPDPGQFDYAKDIHKAANTSGSKAVNYILDKDFLVGLKISPQESHSILLSLNTTKVKDIFHKIKNRTTSIDILTSLADDIKNKGTEHITQYKSLLKYLRDIDDILYKEEYTLGKDRASIKELFTSSKEETDSFIYSIAEHLFENFYYVDKRTANKIVKEIRSYNDLLVSLNTKDRKLVPILDALRKQNNQGIDISFRELTTRVNKICPLDEV